MNIVISIMKPQCSSWQLFYYLRRITRSMIRLIYIYVCIILVSKNWTELDVWGTLYSTGLHNSSHETSLL